MALVRGAILAKAAGFSLLHVVNFNITDIDYVGSANQEAHLTIVGTNDPAEALRCEAREFFVPNCRILPVEATLLTLAPRVGLTPERVDQEVARARAARAAAPPQI